MSEKDRRIHELENVKEIVTCLKITVGKLQQQIDDYINTLR